MPRIFQLSDLDGNNGFVIEGENSGDRLGISVSDAGDINNDGIGDIVIGAELADENPLNDDNRGKAYVIYGQNNSAFNATFPISSLDGSNGFVLIGIIDGDQAGHSVAGVGDVNGDDIDDMIIGAPGAQIDNRGEAYVVFGQGSGFATPFFLSSLDGNNGLIIEGVSGSDNAGLSVNSAGNVNGDGLKDFIIGAPSKSPSRNGESYIIFGRDTGFVSLLPLSSLDGNNGFAIEGIDGSDETSRSVSVAGDINNDGIDDVVIGGFQAEPFGQSVVDERGEAYVVFGQSTGFNATLPLSNLDGNNGFVLEGINSGDGAGYSVSRVGDINGDQIDDLIVGAYKAEPMGQSTDDNRGEAYIVFGRATSFNATFPLSSLDGSNGFMLEGVSSLDRLGQSVSAAGDINGDGINDAVIGGRNAGSGFKGDSFVLFGRDTAFPQTISLGVLNSCNGFVLEGVNSGDNSGFSVSGAGDVNGDGIDDLIIGAYLAEPSSQGSGDNRGESYVVFGMSPRDYNVGIVSPSSPSLNNNQLTINQNETVVLTTMDLSATDPEECAPGLLFQVSNVQHGQFEYVIDPGVSIVEFVQFEVMRGRVHFVHDGSDMPPSYNVSVVDNMGAIPSEAAVITYMGGMTPVIENNRLTISEGETVVLTSSELSASDPDLPAVDLQFNVSSVTNGQFEYVSNQTFSINYFLASEITANQVQFVHDGGETAPSFDVLVSDGSLASAMQAANITFNNVNDLPTLTTNQLMIDEGETLLFSGAELSATDVDNVESTLIFEISGLTRGQFESVLMPGTPITSFSQSNVTGGQIQFVHDGSVLAPSYSVVVFDGIDRTSPASPANITFNTTAMAPLLLNKSLTIMESQRIIITSTALSATSVRVTDDALRYVINDVEGGQFNRLDDGSVSVTGFTQADVNNGQIIFVQDGTESNPGFAVAVTDGELMTAQESVQIDFTPVNDSPTLVNNQLSLQASGDRVVLSADDLSATDEENTDGTLLFEVRDVTHGWFEKIRNPDESITAFFQSEIANSDIRFVHDGSDSAPSYKVRVSDGELATGYQSVAITFTANQKSVNTFSSAGDRQQPLLSLGGLKTSFNKSYEQLTSTLRSWLFTDKLKLIKQEVPEFLQPRVNDWLSRYERLHRRGEYDDVSRWFNYGLEDCKADLFNTIEQGDLTASQLTFFEREVKGLEKTYLSSFGLLEEQQRPKGFMAVSSNRMTLWNSRGETATRELPPLNSRQVDKDILPVCSHENSMITAGEFYVGLLGLN